MLNEKVVELLKQQVNKEFYSAYLYLDMSNYYIDQNLDGFGNWFYLQAKEEQDHAMLFLKYLQNNDISVALEAIDKPDKVYADYGAPLHAALEHEQYVTSLINAIYDQAWAVKDYRTCQFLDWFIKEQGEEEQNSRELIAKYELFAQDTKGLYLLDEKLGERTYSAPSLTL